MIVLLGYSSHLVLNGSNKIDGNDANHAAKKSRMTAHQGPSTAHFYFFEKLERAL